MTGDNPQPLPHDLEAEKCVLGAVLLDNALFDQAREILAPADFYLAAHRALFEHMGALADGSRPIDLTTLASALDDAGQLEACGGRSAISALIDGVPRLANLEHYARIVKDKARARSTLWLFDDGRRMMEQGKALDDVLAAASDALDLVSSGGESARQATPLTAVDTERPQAVLAAKGHSGAVLAAGQICLLSGEGGIAKSALSLSVAIGIAALPDGELGEIAGLFKGRGGPVLMATFEDPQAETAWRSRCLAGHLSLTAPDLERVHVLDLAGRPLFGPTGNRPSYNERPGKLPGWFDLWREARRIRPRLVVVDPALCAYVGEANAAAPVREFLQSVAVEAARLDCGVLLVAHSRKDARSRNQNPDPFDPGQVSGSTAWSDGVRGVLTMTWGEKKGERVLAVSKANYGPSRIQTVVEPYRHPSGAIVGFQSVRCSVVRNAAVGFHSIRGRSYRYGD